MLNGIEINLYQLAIKFGMCEGFKNLDTGCKPKI